MSFKVGIAVALIEEIRIIWTIVFTALAEYDQIHIETLGMGGVVLFAALASPVFWCCFSIR